MKRRLPDFFRSCSQRIFTVVGPCAMLQGDAVLMGHTEVAMMLDDVYVGDVDERFLKQETVWRERLLPELEWDETEESRVAAELLGRSDFRDEAV